MTGINCHFPTCTAQGFIPHDSHLLSEPGSPYPMRVTPDGVYLWLADGTMLKRRQPDAIRHLRTDVRRLDEERQREAAEDAVDVAAKAAIA